jgi:uncharacterized damage-inducible protein DinB
MAGKQQDAMRPGGTMNCYGGKQLAESFRTVRRNTLKIAEEIPEEKYSFKPTPDTKSVGQLLTHIGLGTRFQQQVHQVDKVKTLEGFNFPGLMQTMSAEEQKPRSKAQIIDFLTREGEAWASWLEGLPDDFLSEQVSMPQGTQPATKCRLEMLLSPKEHEMHHRGQLMLIQRMLGITPHLTRDFQSRMAARAAEQARA